MDRNPSRGSRIQTGRIRVVARRHPRVSRMSSEKKSLLRRFFGAIWSVVTFIYRAAVVLSLVLFVVIVFGLTRSNTRAPMQDNLALALIPTGAIVDQLDDDPIQRFFDQANGDPPRQTRLSDLIDALDAAAQDSRITLAAMRLDSMWSIGLAQARELAAAMQRFQAAGKTIHVHDAFLPQSHYLVASQAQDVSLDPLGGVWIEGLSVYNNYFADALDKLGVDVEVFRVGQFKSAVEPFLRNDMSAEARAANREWLGDLWGLYGEQVETARELPTGAVTAYVERLPENLDRLDGDAATLAMEQRLVNQLETIDEYRERIGKIVGMDESGHGSFRQVHFRDYLNVVERERRAAQPPPSSEIALVVIQGEITDGFADPGMSDAQLTADLIDDARRDDRIRSLVLRVNSPGGSVFGSERIRRAVQRMRDAGKPVVVSMGNMAASGGYWVSMDADRIWAHPSTITGSIGIFGLIPTFPEGLSKLGIRTDGTGTTRLAGAFRADRGLSPEARQIIQREIEFGYRQFIDGVSRGRSLSVEEVEALAQGRVWSGADALDLGLVDRLGGLQEAIADAASLADLRPGDYRLERFEPELPWGLKLLQPFGAQGQLSALNGWIGWLQGPLQIGQQVLAPWRWLQDPRGVYAHCLCTSTERSGAQARQRY